MPKILKVIHGITITALVLALTIFILAVIEANKEIYKKCLGELCNNPILTGLVLLVIIWVLGAILVMILYFLRKQLQSKPKSKINKIVYTAILLTTVLIIYILYFQIVYYRNMKPYSDYIPIYFGN